MSKVRVAVVGVGSLGQHHSRIASGSEATDLVAVVERFVEAGYPGEKTGAGAKATI